jgi:hypothetical protein
MSGTVKIILQLRQWTLFRWVKLAMGLMFVFAGIDGGEPVITVFGGILAASSLFGLSQCDHDCEVDRHPSTQETNDSTEVQNGN